MSHRVWAAGVVACAVAGATLIAQGRDERGDSRGDSRQDLPVLILELRQLRLTLEDLTRRQMQAQALASLAVAQQSRVAMTSARLDAARGELATSASQGAAVSLELERVDAQARLPLETTRRRQLEDEIKTLMAEQAALFQREQEARRRVEDLSQALREEDARWTRAVERLEAVSGR